MNTHLNLPTHWNELSVAQQLKAYQIIMGKRLNLFTPAEEVPAKRIMLFQLLTGITDAQLDAWQADCKAANEEHGHLMFLQELDDALHGVDFLFEINTTEEGAKEYAIALTLTRCPFPELDRPKKRNKKQLRYYAPADGLENITFLELCVTFQLFEQYLKQHDDDVLHQLLAVLYRSPKPKTKENKYAGYHGDRRQPYLNHETLVEKRKPHLATLPVEVKQLLLFWFAGCRQHIISQYPDLFKTEGSGRPSKYGWAATLMAMAGSLPNLDTVSNQPADDALAYLDYLNEQAKEAQIDAELQKLTS